MLRLVELDKNLIGLIKNTDNKIFFRPLFFPTIFINNDIEFKNEIIKGILIQEAISHEEMLKETLIQEDKLYFVRMLDSLDKRNTLPHTILQIIEDYDRRGEILTRSKLIDNLKEKGYKYSGEVDSTLTILRDYLNAIVMEP